MPGDAAHEDMRTSNRSIQSKVETEFRQSNYHALHNIQCQYEDGVVSLTGSVPTFHLKQIAFAVARRSLANARIDDRLQVTE